MRRYLAIVVLVGAALLGPACGPAQPAGGAAAAPAGTDAVSVLEALEARWNAKDLDGAMALFAEDAVETNGLGTFTGKEEIRELYADAMQWFSLDCKNYKVDGNKVTYDCLDTAYTGGNKTLETYEAVVEDGKIKANIQIAQVNNP